MYNNTFYVYAVLSILILIIYICVYSKIYKTTDTHTKHYRFDSYLIKIVDLLPKNTFYKVFFL